MKIRCIRLLDDQGREIEFCSWLYLGRIYHVMDLSFAPNGDKTYGIITSHPAGEWPQMTGHPEQCFEIVSNVFPSNWVRWERGGYSGIAPAAWQREGFYEAFYDHDSSVYEIFERERDVILAEDP